MTHEQAVAILRQMHANLVGHRAQRSIEERRALGVILAHLERCKPGAQA